MKPNQRVKGYKLVAGQEYDIEETFKAPIVAIQIKAALLQQSH